MKYVLMLVAVVGVMVAGVFLTLAPMAKMAAGCLRDYDSRVVTNTTLAAKYSWDKQKVCIEGKQPLIDLSGCFSEVQVSHRWPMEAFSLATRVARRGEGGNGLAEAVALHNQACADYPETLIR